ncbi:DUF3443 domain-containing protein [Burkholderia mayonis]|uniref:Lipoprotein n=1 Tax=Burkholderia mayonis TaxID=1385591 RepID=A0A1B4G3G0_9BURK|nr:DUF3443 domain-containing protein [Burkholderia mayonis]AOJ10445.1 hypothetical protein WS71_24925 [Burkholderia mayonis]KVE53574.1 hypothetical protein WS71_05855 [Burkholderia mayonis]
MTIKIAWCIAALAAMLAGCGGGGGSGGSTASNTNGTGVAPSTAANVQPVTVSAGVTGAANMLMTTVTVCVPNTGQCQTIDNVQVDTGSDGLRILASALPSSVALPIVPAAGAPITGACAVFGTGFTWGTVRRADVKIAGEVASNVPIQVIADPSTPNTPADCTQSAGPMQTQGTLRANGILGIGLFVTDCGSACASAALSGWYYACTTSGACTSVAQPIAQQIANPVGAFASDNNGSVIVLPAIPVTGSATVNGSLIFGIGTQADNGLGSATPLATTSSGAYVTSVLNGNTNMHTFFDSGSNGIFFADASLPQCGSWFCPGSTQTFGIALGSGNGASVKATTFQVASSQVLFSTFNFAFDDLAGPIGNVVDLGLPFFYGRSIYTALETRPTPAGPGPYYAF